MGGYWKSQLRKGDTIMNQQMNMGASGQQAQLGNQTVGMMANPPEIITDKDLSYLKDALSWELLAMKKCSHWAQACQDQEIKNLVHKAGQMHQAHYIRLLNELNVNKTLY
jgi:hypothetical protein